MAKTRKCGVFWAVRYSVDTWVVQTNPVQGRANKAHRHLFGTQQEALEVASKIVYPPVVIVKVTRKPAAPPPLAVGDEATVTAKIEQIGPGWVQMRGSKGSHFFVHPADITRGAAK